MLWSGRRSGGGRCGLGLSDPHPTKTLASWTEDIVQFVDANELNKATAVGFSQGAVFAFALAGREVVEAVAIVSGQDELAHPKLASLLHPHVAGLIRTIQDDLVDFERSFARMATKDALWELITGMSCERDRAVYAVEKIAVPVDLWFGALD